MSWLAWLQSQVLKNKNKKSGTTVHIFFFVKNGNKNDDIWHLIFGRKDDSANSDLIKEFKGKIRKRTSKKCLFCTGLFC